MRIGFVGMTTLDTLQYVESLPRKAEDLFRVDSFVSCLGGKGMVPALAAFSLGCEVVLFTLIARPPELRGEILGLLPSGFGRQYIKPWLATNHRTWIAISASKQETQTLVYSSPLSHIDPSVFKRTVRRFLGEVDVLYLSTEHGILVRTTLDLVREHHLPLISNINQALLTDPLDPTGALARSLMMSSSVVFVNQYEADLALSKLKSSNWTKLGGENLREIVITAGERGGRVSTFPFRKWLRYKAVKPKQVLCVVGAGDTFNGAYLKARFVDRREPLASCLYAAKIAAKKLELRSSSLLV